jgi:hypothetical protein
MHELTAWLVSAMVTWVPPRPTDTVRYEAIAEDIANVAVEAPVFPSSDGAARTALLMAAIASFESTYRADIDAFKVKGDHGKSVGLMQVWLRPGEACADRLECLRIGRERIRESFTACRALPFPERLGIYTMGKCGTNAASRYRIGRAQAFWKKSPFVDTTN